MGSIIKTDFVDRLSIANIKNVKANFQFKANDYKTFYIVDTYDVIEYCFPFISAENNHSKSQHYDETLLSYHFLFFENIHRPIILDEYRVELHSFWNGLRENIKEFQDSQDIKSQLIDKYKSINGREGKINFVKSRVGILLALALGTLNKKPIEKYTKLISERLQIENFTFGYESDPEGKYKHAEQVIESIFANSPPNYDRVSTIFNRFCEENMNDMERYLGRLKSSRNLSDDQIRNRRYVLLDNSYRDIEVFDRIVTINQKLYDKSVIDSIGMKVNFLFLSSSPNKTDKIEALYSDHSVNYSDVQNDRIKRNILEAYFFQLIDFNSPNLGLEIQEANFKKSIAYLNQIEEFIKNKDSENNQVYENIFENIDSSGDKEGKIELDDLLVKYKTITSFHERITNKSKSFSSSGDDAELLETFSEIIDLFSTENAKKGILNEVDEVIKSYNDNFDEKAYTIGSYNYLQKQKENSELKIRNLKSKDYVKSIIQSFPIALFHDKFNSSKTEFLSRICFRDSFIKVIHDLIDSPKRKLIGFYDIERNILFLLLRYIFDAAVTEEFALQQLDKLVNINNKSRIRHTIEKRGSQEIIALNYEPNKRIAQELDYFKSWLLRRSNKNEDALLIIEPYFKDKDELDFKLYHSKALCYKNKYYNECDTSSQQKLVAALEESIANFEICKNELLELVENNPTNKLYPLILIGIKVSLCDSQTKLFLYDPKSYGKIIKNESRVIMDEVKAEMKKMSISTDSNTIPTISHTEIDLNYCESYLLIKDDDFNGFCKKIDLAYRLCNEIKDKDEMTGFSLLEKTIERVKRQVRLIDAKACNEDIVSVFDLDR